MFFRGIPALNPDKDPVKEKYPGTFNLVKLWKSREQVFFPLQIRR